MYLVHDLRRGCTVKALENWQLWHAGLDIPWPTVWQMRPHVGPERSERGRAQFLVVLNESVNGRSSIYMGVDEPCRRGGVETTGQVQSPGDLGNIV